ncbi:MAG: peptidoglycan DD-metalloendopeptidase family protein [Acidobacteriaceae bacterium]
MPKKDRYLDEFPELEDHAGGSGGKLPRGETNKERRLALFKERLAHAGLGETFYRLGTALLTVAVILLALVGMRLFYLHFQQTDLNPPREAVLAAEAPTPTPTAIPAIMPDFSLARASYVHGITRLALIHTTIPSRPRTEIITYTVQTDDNIFAIADMFGLKPETILWGNLFTLADNPELIYPGQVLNIMPTNGIYHRWSEGEGLNGVAHGYNVTPDVIVNWPGNRLDPATLGDYSHPSIEAGTMLFVPGGSRSFVTWSAPRISRDNPGVARILGPGSCGTVVDGAVGTGAFIWPANNHWLSGYDYSPSTNHFGIDIAGSLGDAIYAADNGVVVYAGWNDWGYGNVVVIDHDFGWQTLYAHLSVLNVGCGQSVYQGDVIGYFGSTGRSSGPHLHFEMLNESYGKVNPHNFLP